MCGGHTKKGAGAGARISLPLSKLPPFILGRKIMGWDPPIANGDQLPWLASQCSTGVTSEVEQQKEQLLTESQAVV